MGIIPDTHYQRNMQSVIEQKDDKGISPFCEQKARRSVRRYVGHLHETLLYSSCYEQLARHIFWRGLHRSNGIEFRECSNKLAEVARSEAAG